MYGLGFFSDPKLETEFEGFFFEGWDMPINIGMCAFKFFFNNCPSQPFERQKVGNHCVFFFGGRFPHF